MYIVLLIMLIAACLTLFFCGYYLAVINQKVGRSIMIAVPITIALFMFNIIWALLELSQEARWQ